MNNVKKLLALSLLDKLRLVIEVVLFLLLYIRWDHPEVSFSSVGFGVVIVSVLVRLSIWSPNQGQEKRSAESRQSFLLLSVLYVALFAFVYRYSVYEDQISGSLALPLHVMALLLLVVLYIMHLSGRFSSSKSPKK